MTLRTRLRIGIVVTLLLTILMIALQLVMKARLNRLLVRMDTATNIVKAVSELELSEYDEILNRDHQLFQSWAGRYDTLAHILGKELFPGDVDKALLQDIRWNFEKSKASFYRLTMEYGLRYRIQAEGRRLTSEEDRHIAEREHHWQEILQTSSHIMVHRAYQLESRAQYQVNREQQTASSTLIICLALISVVVMLTSMWTERSIMSSLLRLKEGTEIIGSGNLDYRIDAPQDDEIGEVAQAFDEMTGKLQETTTRKDALQREVAERQKAEAALREINQTLHEILSASPVGIVKVEDMIITWTNEAFRQIFDDPEDRVYSGHSVLSLWVDQKEYVALEEGVLQSLANGRPAEGTALVQRRGGSQFPAHLKLSCRDPKHPLARAVVTISDETERLRVQQEQMKWDRLQGALELAGTVCHELNQPLQFVLGTCEMQIMKAEARGESGEVFERIRQSAERIAGITQKLMGITRYETVEYGKGVQIFDIFQEEKQNDETLGTTDPNRTRES